MTRKAGMKLDDMLGNGARTAKTLVKMLLQTRLTRLPRQEAVEGEALYIMGNGPSLRCNLDEHLDFLRSHITMAVNFAANSNEFAIVRPRYYVLADPYFFADSGDQNVAKLFRAINGVEWPMTLYVPASARGVGVPVSHGNLRVEKYNYVAAEGYEWVEQLAFDHGWGMPRPRNVLIPSIMIGIWLGYKTIYLLGADHSWLQSIWVNDDNRVVTVQPHFYEDSAQEKQRVYSEYSGHKLHDVLESFHIAFKSYHKIEEYARSRDVRILNATPGSFIDAFPRSQFPPK